VAKVTKSKSEAPKLKSLGGALATALAPPTPAPDALAPPTPAPDAPEQTHAEVRANAAAAGLLFRASDLDPMLESMNEVLIHLYRLAGSVTAHLWRPESADQTLRLGMLASMLGMAGDHVGRLLQVLLSPAQMQELVKANPQVVRGLAAAYGPEVEDLVMRVEARAAARVGN